MAFGGGQYLKYDKVMPGTYINTITVGEPTNNVTSGIVAGGLSLDWGPEGEAFMITADQFKDDAEAITGYSYSDDRNVILREVFQHADRFLAYRLNSGGKAAANEAVGEARYPGSVGNKVTVTCYRNVNNENKFDVCTYYDGVLKDTQKVGISSIDEVTLTKGEETPGEEGVGVEKVEIEKHGFVKTKAELDTAIGAGTSAKIDHDNNVFYIYFKEKPADVKNYLVQFEVDSKVYACNFADAQGSLIGLGKGTAHNTDLDYAKDGVTWKAHDKSEVDVTGKTVKMALLRYSKPTSLEVLNSEEPTTIIEPVEINCSASVAKGAKTVSIGEAISVDFEATDTQIVATVSNKPDNYSVYTTIKTTSDVVIAETPGVMEITEEGDKYTLTVTPKVGDQNLKLEVSAIKNAKGEKKKVIKTVAFTTAVEEDAYEGADVTQIKNNNYVAFKKDGIIEEGAGYVFEGGASGSSVKVSDYNNMLNALEGKNFNNLVYDGSDSIVKELFAEYTKRLRDQRGIYFQTILNDYAEADYEGVISVYNPVESDNPEVKPGSLVWWVAGYASAVSLNNEVTNKPYDGELTIDVSTPDAQIEILYELGNLVFHKVSETEIYSLFDVNTLTTYTEDHDEQLRENKVIRIIDYLHNSEAYILNRNNIGVTPNTVDGRAQIWTQCLELLEGLQSSGAITGFDSSNLTVEPVTGDKHAVTINQSFTVTGTIYRVYITTYVVQ